MVIFSDLSEVLIRGLYGTEKIVAQRYGAKTGERFWNRHVETDSQFQDLLRGRMLEDLYWSDFLDPYDSWPFGVEEAEAMFSDNLRQEIDGDVLKIYQRIIRHPERIGRPRKMVDGMPDIYLVSDHIYERLDEIKEYHPRIFHLVKKVFWSCELGRIKADPDFFPTLLGLTGLDPQEVLFIDDNLDNVISAGKAGISSICYHNVEMLEKTLARNGFVLAPPAP